MSAALGTLLLAVIRPLSPMLAVRAAKWHRDLERLGISLPLFLVHDIGLLFAAPHDQLLFGPRMGAAEVLARIPATVLWERYVALVEEIRSSEACQSGGGLRLSDDLVTVLLARIFGGVARKIGKSPYGDGAVGSNPELFRGLEAKLVSMFQATPRNWELDALAHVMNARLQLLTLTDSIDLDTLRLLGMLGPEGSTAGALGHVDLLAALTSPGSNDIVNFSLELLPAILETTRMAATGTRATDGYAGLGTKGSVDSMVLTELAWDDAEFARRMIENETLYYTREQSHEEAKRLHVLLVDASASMRGDRQTFARGLAIALGKKLQLQGEDVVLRFFDSRLYEPQRTRGGQFPAAYVLSFKGERGRNPSRVFAQLANELALLRTRDARDPVVHLITHAALHVPRSLVSEVRKYAHLFGIFILPSSRDGDARALDLDYLDLLEGHAIIDHDTLTSRSKRAAAASQIVVDAAAV